MRKNFGTNPYFFPLPVLIVGSYDGDGNANAMNAAWGGLYDADQVILCLSAGHKTTQNILKNGAFTVSFGTLPQMKPCDYVGLVSANNTPDKMEKAGFTTKKSEFVNARSFRNCLLHWNAALLKRRRTATLSARSSTSVPMNPHWMKTVKSAPISCRF